MSYKHGYVKSTHPIIVSEITDCITLLAEGDNGGDIRALQDKLKDLVTEVNQDIQTRDQLVKKNNELVQNLTVQLQDLKTQKAKLIQALKDLMSDNDLLKGINASLELSLKMEATAVDHKRDVKDTCDAATSMFNGSVDDMEQMDDDWEEVPSGPIYEC